MRKSPPVKGCATLAHKHKLYAVGFYQESSDFPKRKKRQVVSSLSEFSASVFAFSLQGIPGNHVWE